MSITNTLATVFTLLIFVMMTVTMYDKMNLEVFRQYKGAIFAGSTFLFLAILGLPYMEYDVAHKVPSFTFVSLGIGILAILCTILMFILDWSFDTFVAYISTFVIFATMLSKVSGSDVGATEFPAFAKVMLQFILAGGVILGTWKGAEAAVGNETVQKIQWLRILLEQYAQIAPIGLLGMLVYAIYRVITGLVEYRKEAKGCKKTVVDGVAPYEAFQNPVTPLKSELQAAIARAQDSIDSLVDQTDQTCAIIREVEQGYLGTKSGPEDEAEFNMPQEEQQRRKEKRQERAMKSFAINRSIFAASRNTTPLECFQNPNTEFTEVSDEVLVVRELCTELHGLLENAETLAQISKIKQMDADLDFAQRQLTKAEEEQKKSESFQNSSQEAPSATGAPSLSPTQIYANMNFPLLGFAARKLLQKEQNLFTSLKGIKQKVVLTRMRMGKTYQKANMVATGDYNVTQAELEQPTAMPNYQI